MAGPNSDMRTWFSNKLADHGITYEDVLNALSCVSHAGLCQWFKEGGSNNARGLRDLLDSIGGEARSDGYYWSQSSNRALPQRLMFCAFMLTASDVT